MRFEGKQNYFPREVFIFVAIQVEKAVYLMTVFLFKFSTTYKTNHFTEQHFFLLAYQGVSRELWDTRFLNAMGFDKTGEFLENAGDPDIKEEISSFEAGSSGNFYVQRLQSYFLPTSNGDYIFDLTCSVGCYVFIDDVYINLFHYDGDINLKWSR